MPSFYVSFKYNLNYVNPFNTPLCGFYSCKIHVDQVQISKECDEYYFVDFSVALYRQNFHFKVLFSYIVAESLIGK